MRATAAAVLALLLTTGSAQAQFKEQYDYLEAIGPQGRHIFVSGFTVAAIGLQGACAAYDGALCPTQEAIVECWRTLAAKPGADFVTLGTSRLDEALRAKSYAQPVGKLLIDTYAAECLGRPTHP